MKEKDKQQHKSQFKQEQAGQDKQAQEATGKLQVDIREYEELKKKAAQSQEYFERLLRLQAEFENTKKRLQREKAEFIKFANEEIISELLIVLDDLERAVESARKVDQKQEDNKEDISSLVKGVELTLIHLTELLKKKGLLAIEAKGKPFDPHLHEAWEMVNSELPEGIVAQELQRGYMLNGRVIRTAKVKVSKKPETRVQEPDLNGSAERQRGEN
jgi:molecular chaperone GrpE